MYLCKCICKYNLRRCVIHSVTWYHFLCVSCCLSFCFELCIIATFVYVTSHCSLLALLWFVSDWGFCCISTFWWHYIFVACVELPLLPLGYRFCLFLPFWYMMLELFRKYDIFVFVFFIILHGWYIKSKWKKPEYKERKKTINLKKWPIPLFNFGNREKYILFC